MTDPSCAMCYSDSMSKPDRPATSKFVAVLGALILVGYFCFVFRASLREGPAPDFSESIAVLIFGWWAWIYPIVGIVFLYSGLRTSKRNLVLICVGLVLAGAAIMYLHRMFYPPAALSRDNNAMNPRLLSAQTLVQTLVPDSCPPQHFS